MNSTARRRLLRYIDKLIDVAAQGNAPFNHVVVADIEAILRTAPPDLSELTAFDHREGMDIYPIPCAAMAARTRKPCRLRAEWLRENGRLYCHTHRWRKN